MDEILGTHRVRRARSCVGRACIPATSWTGDGPGTAGRWPARPGPAGARRPIREMPRSRACVRRRPSLSRSWPRPASWWMSSLNCRRSRRARSSAVSPPPSAYLMLPAYRTMRRPSAELVTSAVKELWFSCRKHFSECGRLRLWHADHGSEVNLHGVVAHDVTHSRVPALRVRPLQGTTRYVYV